MEITKAQEWLDKDIYVDPPEQEMIKILDTLKNIGDHNSIQNLITSTYPSWLLFSLEKYSTDYPHLEKNWEALCNRTGVQKQKIVVVDAIIKDNEHLLINIFCERMTREGYIVRRNGELTACVKCNKAMPTETVYKHMKALNLPVPDEWSNTCNECKV